MKNFILLTLVATLLLSFVKENSDDEKKGKPVPSVTIRDMDGNEVDTGNLQNDGKPIILSFWATWCSPCKRELAAISEVYDDWVEETGVVLYAISIDDEKTKSKVKPYMDGKAYDFKVLLDVNSDFRRALGVNNVPHTFLINGDGKIIWSHNSYSQGDEEELYEQILKLTNK